LFTSVYRKIKSDILSLLEIQNAEQKSRIDEFQAALDEKYADRIETTNEMIRIYKRLAENPTDRHAISR
jgi:uncharacterized coiled-coil protein SlyX